MRLETDFPTGATKLDGEIRIFAWSDGTAAYSKERLTAECCEGARRYEQDAKHVRHAPAKRDADQVLNSLKARQQIHMRIADTDVPGNAADAGISERLHQAFDGIAIEGRVDVCDDDDLTGAIGEAKVRGSALSTAHAAIKKYVYEIFGSKVVANNRHVVR